MADAVDQTLDNESALLNFRIQDIRNAGREILPRQHCHWCEEPFAPDSKKLFCDAECAQEWERNK